MRYTEATELLLSGTPLTGSVKRAAMRAREIHYTPSQRKTPGVAKLRRKLSTLPIAKLSQCIRRATHAIIRLEKLAMRGNLFDAGAAGALQARAEAFKQYRALVQSEANRRIVSYTYE